MLRGICLGSTYANYFSSGDYFIDANGNPAERVMLDGQPVVIHFVDMPESDITTVNGVRVTTPIRTVIDMATEVGRDELVHMVREFLDRGLFTVDETLARISQADMQNRLGAIRVREVVMDLR